jgi:hypothetical protein
MARALHILGISIVTKEDGVAHPIVHIAWFIVGAVSSFLIPFIFTSTLNFHHDLYYLIYFTITAAFLTLYVKTTRVDLLGFFRRNWRWSLALGVLATAFVVFNVLSREATPGPTGPYLAFEVFWRGATYGIVDALLLTTFPGLVALGLLKGNLGGIFRKAGYVVTTLVMVLVITGMYHLGYEQFREVGVREPEIGNTIISVPMLATANPVGSIVAHTGMHVAATLYSYETEVFLPPQTEAP